MQSDQISPGIYRQACKKEDTDPDDESPQHPEYGIALDPFYKNVHGTGYSIWIYIFYPENKNKIQYLTLFYESDVRLTRLTVIR